MKTVARGNSAITGWILKQIKIILLLESCEVLHVSRDIMRCFEIKQNGKLVILEIVYTKFYKMS